MLSRVTPSACIPLWVAYPYVCTCGLHNPAVHCTHSWPTKHQMQRIARQLKHEKMHLLPRACVTWRACRHQWQSRPLSAVSSMHSCPVWQVQHARRQQCACTQAVNTMQRWQCSSDNAVHRTHTQALVSQVDSNMHTCPTL